MKFFNRIKNKILIVVSMIIFSASAFAGIGIDPNTLELILDPSGETNGVWKIVNSGEKTLSVKIEVDDWLQKGIKPDTWLKIMPMDFILAPGANNEVSYSINIGSETNDEYMSMVFFNATEEGNTIGSGFSVPVYAVIKGKENIIAEIKDLNITYENNTGIQGWLVIENKGNVHIRPYTNIQILNSEGKAVAYFSVPYGLPVQVNKERKFDFSNENTKLEPGKYTVMATSECGKLYSQEKKIEKECELVVGNMVINDKQEIENAETDISETSVSEINVSESSISETNTKDNVTENDLVNK
jgi:P pilus assembly chaperone PapD